MQNYCPTLFHEGGHKPPASGQKPPGRYDVVEAAMGTWKDLTG
jgi:hypothetical protein